MARYQVWMAGLGMLLAAALLGCGTGQRVPPPPATQKTEGVVLKKDGKPVNGGSIEFRSVQTPEFVSLGDVGQDGRFTLRTMGGSQDVSGAQEGENTVTYMPPLSDKGEGTPVVLSKTYAIKPGANNITVTLEQ